MIYLLRNVFVHYILTFLNLPEYILIILHLYKYLTSANLRGIVLLKEYFGYPAVRLT